MPSENEYLGDTLAQVNLVRSAFGYDQLYELPDSKRGDVASCLFYRALKDVGCQNVGGSSLEFSSERQAAVIAELWGTKSSGKTVVAPKQMSNTIGRFDNGDLPHYDIGRRESSSY